MRIVIVLFILSFFSVSITLVSCDEKQGDTSKQATTADAQSDTITIDVTEKLKPELRLTKRAADSAADWQLYNSLDKLLPEMKQATIDQLKEKIVRAHGLFEQQEQAENTTAPILDNRTQPPSINARLLVIETKIRLLNDLLYKEQLDRSAIEIQLIELHNAFQNMKLQMNERYAKSVQEMLEELQEEQEESLDQTLPESPLQGRPTLITTDDN